MPSVDTVIIGGMSLWHTLLDLLFPPRCIICRRPGTWLCVECTPHLPYITGPVCQHCGEPLSHGTVCRRCRQTPLRLEGIRVGSPLRRSRARRRPSPEVPWRPDAGPSPGRADGDCLAATATRGGRHRAGAATSASPAPAGLQPGSIAGPRDRLAHGTGRERGGTLSHPGHSPADAPQCRSATTEHRRRLPLPRWLPSAAPACCSWTMSAPPARLWKPAPTRCVPVAPHWSGRSPWPELVTLHSLTTTAPGHICGR
jgi:hypothetical protein